MLSSKPPIHHRGHDSSPATELSSMSLHAKNPILTSTTADEDDEDSHTKSEQLSTSAHPTRPTLDENESFHIRSLSSQQNESLMLSSIRDVITHNDRIYWFSCVTGIISPQSFENASGSYSKHNLRFRLWGWYLHICLFASTLFLFAAGLVYCILPGQRDDIAIIACICFSIAFQNCMLYPAIVYLRREIDLKRNDVNRLIYEEAFMYALDIGRRIFVFLFVLMFIFFIVQGIELHSLYESTRIAFLYIFIEFSIYAPCNVMLTGLFTFLVMEQRISYFTMQSIEHRMNEKTLSDAQYLQAKESINLREKVTPINWLVFGAIVTTLFGIIVIFFLTRFEYTTLGAFSIMMQVLTTFGRQTLVLIIFLLEIAKVNEIHEMMIHHLAKTRWIGEDTKRINLYIVMKEIPMGSSVFFYRPSKFELLLQIGSSLLGIGFAIFWAVVFA